MVVDNPSSERVDRLFHALANRTRRSIVQRAATGDRSVSALARGFDMSVTAVQKHVGVLEDAGLVRKQRHGREQIVTTRPETLDAVRDALDALEIEWRERLGRFDAALNSNERER